MNDVDAVLIAVQKYRIKNEKVPGHYFLSVEEALKNKAMRGQARVAVRALKRRWNKK